VKLQGEFYLEQNKTKEGVVTLPSGLQYKVLRAGTGDSHPTADSQCDCHYAGRLIDGTEFDSSYKRGEPTAFAPNQVIKGWTEAMQLMVEGEKWEMYIPFELAYGKRGSPPKIPGEACLIFEMEIIKIRGKKVPKK
jgi:FKBP-type peptidyl-prolyl cis-trans isomerase FklB